MGEGEALKALGSFESTSVGHSWRQELYTADSAVTSAQHRGMGYGKTGGSETLL